MHGFLSKTRKERSVALVEPLFGYVYQWAAHVSTVQCSQAKNLKYLPSLSASAVRVQKDGRLGPSENDDE